MSLSTRRSFVSLASAAAGAAVLRPGRARAATKLRFQMSWFAEAELGGFYQAKATGLYDKAGFDVDLLGGGPQVNGVQLLVGNQADMLIGYDIQVFNAIERNLPIRAIAATFQVDLQGLLARPNIQSPAELKGHKIYISGSGNTTYWPWLRQKFGFTDDMIGVKGVNLQTFFADPTSAVAGYLTAEPFVAQKNNVPIRFLQFSDWGWPTYTNPIIANTAYLAANQDRIRPFLQASMEGWKSYLADPAPGNALIKELNPRMEDDQLAYSVDRLKAINAAYSGDAATRGLGCMTETRWRATRDMMVSTGLLKESADWKKAFTTEYIDDVKVMK
jgi:NitT/TauT family transport system substrate-binding protein